jgi:hypothetical protein
MQKDEIILEFIKSLSKDVPPHHVAYQGVGDTIVRAAIKLYEEYKKQVLDGRAQ